MRKNVYAPLAVGLCLAMLSSCSSLYMPNVPATPMFQRQGEGYMAAHINLKGNVSGSAGYALGKKVALIANGSLIKQGDNSSNEQFEQQLWEGGIGYFTKMGAQKRQVFEVYGGYGQGNSLSISSRASTTGMLPTQREEMDFDKIFVQVNYSSTRKRKLHLMGKDRNLHYGTAIRVSHIAMRDFQVNGFAAPKEENVFIEPLFFTRMDLSDHLQLQYTNGFNFNLMQNEYLKAGNSVFTLGLTYRFGSSK